MAYTPQCTKGRHASTLYAVNLLISFTFTTSGSENTPTFVYVIMYGLNRETNSMSANVYDQLDLVRSYVN